jgi:hypothetical protein
MPLGDRRAYELVLERRRPAADDQPGAAVGHGIERGEVGVEPHGILCAEHGNRAAEPDPFRTTCDRGEDDVAGGVHELGAVVLADVERVDPGRLGQDRFFALRVASAPLIGCPDRSTVTGRKVSRPNSSVDIAWSSSIAVVTVT